MTVYVTDKRRTAERWIVRNDPPMNDFGAINEVYGSYFAKEPPARSFVQVAALPKGVPIEIEGIATKKAR